MQRNHVRCLFKRGLPLTAAAAATLLLWQPSDAFRVAHEQSQGRLRHTLTRFDTGADDSGVSTQTVAVQCQRGGAIFSTQTAYLDAAIRPRPAKPQANATAADAYYQEHGKIPRPAVMHATLPISSLLESKQDDGMDRQGILVIGDVHGCLEELQVLHETAVAEHNNGKEFICVILVGDLVNKGPSSVEVIRHVRTTDRWFSVRGNHDDGALAAALGDPKRQGKPYQWMFAKQQQASEDSESKSNGKGRVCALSDEDVEWLSEMPYTLRIPGWFLQQLASSDDNLEVDDVDTLIVHAGLVPDVDLTDQSIEAMVTVRQVERCLVDDENNDQLGFSFVHARSRQERGCERYAWASLWQGPFRIIFGHDAKRGIQRYANDWAIGIDSGACYGNGLTGIILPARKLVSIPSVKAHAPIGN